MQAEGPGTKCLLDERVKCVRTCDDNAEILETQNDSVEMVLAGSIPR